MIFNIKTKLISEVKKYPKNSGVVIFCSNNDEFEKKIDDNKLSISSLQINNFKNDKNSEIQIWDVDNPNMTIIKKSEINNNFNVDYFRDYFAGLMPTLKKLNIDSLFIEIPKYFDYETIFKNEEYFYQTIVEGVHLGNYSFDVYKSDRKKQKNLAVNFITSRRKSFGTSLKIGEAVTSSVFFTRNLVNEPANILTPQELAKRVRQEFNNSNVSVKIFNEKELKRRKMNAILSVGRASENKPLLIIAHYKPNGKAVKKIALVGKGVTYDTGGLSIKPTSGMIDMKVDMAGGATVFGIIKSASLINLPIEIVGIVPAVENVIAGNAYKPGDVISTASGKTIEVKDTDAEGRIVLADALEYATKQKPDEILDFATLTGAVVVSLGLFTAGIFTKNDEMANKILSAGKSTYEHVWRLPFWDEYNKLIESKIADVSNLGSRWGGAITAGKFLEHFVDENIPWTHIDIAGPAIKHDLTNYTKDYCTGYGVRLISSYLSTK